MNKLTRDFYQNDALTLAPALLGKILVHEHEGVITSGIIVETEAYCGPNDKAAHSFNNRCTPRTAIFFGDGGFAYVYLVYGMHCCFNVTANIAGRPECVLVRALEPLEGIDTMKARRNTTSIINLCNGPGKLCAALGITRELYGEDLCGEKLYILSGRESIFSVKTSPRIGIYYAEEYRNVLWRFYVEGSKYVSRVRQKTPPA